ncbi:MAG: DUF1987 domain-containing protein [Magnetospirillum sp.]|nr:DUF1987 domain-containing protein [Magnetospirillum sp.]
MERLHIAATERSPEVAFDFDEGVFALRGESYPEDASRVFGPVFSALSAFLADRPKRALRFDIELIYFNSSSAKALMNMLQMLDKAAAAGVDLAVNWRFAPDDETMREFGEDFSEDLEHVTFNLVTVEPAG